MRLKAKAEYPPCLCGDSGGLPYARCHGKQPYRATKSDVLRFYAGRKQAAGSPGGAVVGGGGLAKTKEEVEEIWRFHVVRGGDPLSPLSGTDQLNSKLHAQYGCGIETAVRNRTVWPVIDSAEPTGSR